MDLPKDLPFKVGQFVESRSFEKGYRGAWFRSKINTISKKKGQLGYHLKYLDFPDEENTWTKAYEKPKGSGKSVKRNLQTEYELMVRPSYPPIYRESQMPDVNAISDVVVVVNDVWKVGDLIDWWKDDCYWSGSITEMAEDDKVQIVLLPPPLGEGLRYKACTKDLRPSLHWSLEHGWTVPTPKGSKNGGCARIVNPIKQGKVPSPVAGNASYKKRDVVDDIVGASQSSYSSSQSQDLSDNNTAKTSCPDSGSSSHAKSKSIEVTEMGNETEERRGGQDTAASSGSSLPRGMSENAEKQPSVSTAEKETRAVETNGSPGKTSCPVGDSRLREAGSAEIGDTLSEKDGSGHDGKMLLNSMFFDTTEAAILDLEELLIRVKWTKGLLPNRKASSSTARPPWKFLEQRASSKPK